MTSSRGSGPRSTAISGFGGKTTVNGVQNPLYEETNSRIGGIDIFPGTLIPDCTKVCRLTIVLKLSKVTVTNR
jgi:hypothetical protein